MLSVGVNGFSLLMKPGSLVPEGAFMTLGETDTGATLTPLAIQHRGWVDNALRAGTNGVNEARRPRRPRSRVEAPRRAWLGLPRPLRREVGW